ncbi:MAG TPA: ankyrin repeat domain-containing protein [Bryobacteraceae bacterium]|nr:ankyrin repeat domain-containing protein [Bryobacteraceae bacterium]
MKLEIRFLTRRLVPYLMAGACLFSVPALAAPPAAAGSGEALLEAVQNDDQAAVETLLKQKADVNAREDDGATPLAWAALRSNAGIAALLLKAGANPNLRNEQGISPLYLAITNGSPAVVKLLLEHGADPNLARENGETPLMAATHLGQIDVMKMLLARGADVNAREKKFGQAALMWAAGHPAAVRLLVDHGADVHATSKVWDITATIYTPTTSTIGKTGIPWNNDGTYTSKQGGQNALFFAVQQHDLESARILLDAGVDVNVAAADGTTPLLAALYKWDPLGKEFVAGKGAPAPAGSSAHFGADLAMANFLLDRGAKVNVADGAGYTPLHGAALAVAAVTTLGRDRSAYGGGRVLRSKAKAAAPAGGNSSVKLEEALAMVKRLLDLGADPNRQTLYPTSGPVGDVRINPAPPGSSAFHIAANSDCLELVTMLAAKGANPNLVRKDGHTPFSVAVLSDNVAIVKEMVARGANLTARYNPTDHFADPVKPISLPRSNQTIMHIAAGAGAAEVIEYLYSLGVGLEAKNSMGETPLDLADHQERYREARAREAAEDKPNRVVKRDTSTTDAIKKLLASRSPAVAAR